MEPNFRTSRWLEASEGHSGRSLLSPANAKRINKITKGADDARCYARGSEHCRSHHGTVSCPDGSLQRAQGADKGAQLPARSSRHALRSAQPPEVSSPPSSRSSQVSAKSPHSVRSDIRSPEPAVKASHSVAECGRTYMHPFKDGYLSPRNKETWRVTRDSYNAAAGGAMDPFKDGFATARSRCHGELKAARMNIFAPARRSSAKRPSTRNV